MIKKRIRIILSSIACVCLCAVAFIQLSLFKGKASAEAYTSTDFKMITDSSIRKDAEMNGIRFTTFIGNDSAQADGEYWTTHEMGTLFIPKKAMTDGQELKVGERYSGISPVLSKFDGKIENLTTSDEYANGKLFNAVLDLTNYTDKADALNTEIVARTYVKDKTSGEITYLEQLEYSPALTAAQMIQAGDEDELLYTYVDKVEFVSDEDTNVLYSDQITLDLTANVKNFPMEIAVDKGELDGKALTPSERTGVVSITASLLGDWKTTEYKLCLVDSVGLERQYYAEKDIREVNSGSVYRNDETEYLTLRALNVSEIKLNGDALPQRWYTITEDSGGLSEIQINAAKLLSASKSNNELTLVSADTANLSIPLDFNYANADVLPEELDYSASDKKFNITAYASVSDNGGKGETNTSHSFYSEAYIAEYYDCGMSFLQGGSAAQSYPSYSNTFPETSDLYVTLKRANALGKRDSVIVTDASLNDVDRLCIANNYAGYTNQTIYEIYKGTSKKEYPTFIKKDGGDWQFDTQKDFDAYVYERVKIVAKDPAFGGFLLRDEPSMVYMPLVAELYQSIHRAYEKLGLTNKRVVVNLLPLYPGSSFPTVTGDSDSKEGYRAYLDTWLTLSGAKELQMDIYSLYVTGIYRQHIVNLQIAAEVAKKHNAKISVINSCWQRVNKNGEADERFHTYQDMLWMNNITMAYGAGGFGWYTYHMDGSATVTDGASPLTKAGKKTEIYDYVREINAKAQVLAPVILNFDYVKGGFYNNFTKNDQPKDSNGNFYSKTASYSSDSFKKNNYTKITNVKLNTSSWFDKYSWLINELKDSSNGNYMYAVMNVIDSLSTNDYHDDEKSITLTFESGYNKAWVYRGGKFTVENLTDSKLTLSNMIGGDCCYVIPFVG